MYSRSNVLGVKIDMMTFIVGKLSTQDRHLKPFEPKVYKDRGWPLTNSGRGEQYYNNENRNRFYDKGRSYDKIKSDCRNNKNFRRRNHLEMTGAEVNIIEVIGKTLKIETGHINELEAGIEMIE